MFKLTLFAILACICIEFTNSELLIAKPYFKPVQTGEAYLFPRPDPNWRTSPTSTPHPDPSSYYHPGQIYYYPAPAPVPVTENPTQSPMVVTVRLPTAEENGGYGTGIRITHISNQPDSNTISGAESEQSFSTENPTNAQAHLQTHAPVQSQGQGQVGHVQPQLHYYYHQVPAVPVQHHGYHQNTNVNQPKLRGHQAPGMLESLMSLPSRWNRFARRTMSEYYRIKAMRQSGLM